MIWPRASAGKRRSAGPDLLTPSIWCEKCLGHVDTQSCHGRFAFVGCAAIARADRAAGDACAGQLTTSDAKAICAATTAARPTKATMGDTVERETRALVNSKKIAWDVARDNGVAAASCVTRALEQIVRRFARPASGWACIMWVAKKCGTRRSPTASDHLVSGKRGALAGSRPT